MSIRINRERCISCGGCSAVCPGNLIEHDGEKKAFIKYPSECWGCTACLKECPIGAIEYYLGADIGGKGCYMYTEKHSDFIDWFVVKPSGTKHHIKINKRESNKY